MLIEQFKLIAHYYPSPTKSKCHGVRRDTGVPCVLMKTPRCTLIRVGNGHCFWFLSAGLGCRKSRCLDGFTEILRQTTSAIDDGENLQKRLENMYIFKLLFENGTKSIGRIPPAWHINCRNHHYHGLIFLVHLLWRKRLLILVFGTWLRFQGSDSHKNYLVPKNYQAS